jgi:hypothetical protein
MSASAAATHANSTFAPVCASLRQLKCEVAQMPMEYEFAPVRQLRQLLFSNWQL